MSAKNPVHVTVSKVIAASPEVIYDLVADITQMPKYSPENTAGAWIKGAPGAQETLVEAATERFFRPPYVGHRGWVGARLDVETVDWDEIAGLLEEAWRMTAPKKVLAAWVAERPPE